MVNTSDDEVFTKATNKASELKLVSAQHRQLVDFTRKNVRFNQLPSLFEDDEKNDESKPRVYKPDKILAEWTAEEVNNWLTVVDSGMLGEFAPRMKEDDVNGECLLSLTRHELKHTYGMTRAQIKRLFEELFEIDPLHRMKMEGLYSEREISNKKLPRTKTSFFSREDLPASTGDAGVLIGDIVFLGVESKYHGKARVCYTGKTSFGKGEYVGLELIDDAGEHDGEYLGERYFTCQKGKGVFVRNYDIKDCLNKEPSSSSVSNMRNSKILSMSKSLFHLSQTTSYYQQMELAVSSQDGISKWELSSDSDTDAGIVPEIGVGSRKVQDKISLLELSSDSDTDAPLNGARSSKIGNASVVEIITHVE